MSYARVDAWEYAVALATALAEQKVICFVDQWGSVPGTTLPKKLIRQLERSTMLVVIGSPGAATSIPMQQEVELFKATGRTIIPISIEGSAEKSVWWAPIAGITRAPETADAWAAATPSASVLKAVTGASGFVRKTKVLRRALWLTVATMAVVIGVSIFSARQALVARRETAVYAARAESARKEAAAQEQRARDAAAAADAAVLASEAATLRGSEVRTATQFAPDQSDLPVLLAIESAHRTPGRMLPAAQYVLRWAVRMLAAPDGVVDVGADAITAVDSYGRRVAAGYSDGLVRVWNRRGERIAEFRTGKRITALAFPYDSTRLAIGSGLNLLYVDHSRPRRVADTLLMGWQVDAMAFGTLDYDIHGAASRPGGRSVIFSASAKRSPGFRPDTGTVEIPRQGRAVVVELSDRRIAVTTDDSVYIATTGSRVPEAPKAVMPIQYGTWRTFDVYDSIVHTSSAGELLFQRLDTLRSPPRIVPIPGHYIGKLAVSRGHIAVSSNTEKPVQTVHVVGLYGDNENARILHPAFVKELHYPRQNSSVIVTVGDDGKLRRWAFPRLDDPSRFDSAMERWTPAKLVEEAERRVQRKLRPAELERFLRRDAPSTTIDPMRPGA